jgi:6-phosphofructokinase 2
MNKQLIVTITVNPAVDKSAHFKGLVPEQKIRCGTPRFDAGGGGINVSKAVSRLGGESVAVFMAGGATGVQLQELLDQDDIKYKTIATKSWTRESFVAVDDNTNSQYRFGFPGGVISHNEATELLDVVSKLEVDFLVISGSLNASLATGFYQQMAVIAKKRNIKAVIDTSGEALEKVLETGVYLIKPNVGELAKLVGVEKLELQEVQQAALQIINKGGAEVVVVSLGAQGAVLVTSTICEFVSAPNVVKKSTVGAGDSMVGGMVWALSQKKSLKEVIRWGVACGSAATMNEGTQLFKIEDARRLFAYLQER